MAKHKEEPTQYESIPAQISPMLCTLVKEPPRNARYIFEYKWDGYRIVSFVENGRVRMHSRSGLDYTKKYPLIAAVLADLGRDVVVDGEVVVFNKEDYPDFDALQLYNGHTTPITYCVFDLLWMDGQDLRGYPLTERKELLKILVSGRDHFRFSESYDDGQVLYEEVLKKNLEGVVAKDKESEYIPGDRSSFWLKIPTRKRQEFVIGGWAESDKSRSFKSLLFGAYENGKFMWIGRSGGGYKSKEMPGILKQLKQLEIPESPFENEVLDTKKAVMHWTKPELVANFEFSTWTKSGRIRKPATFLGFRKDKDPGQVVREVPKEIRPALSPDTVKSAESRKKPSQKQHFHSNWLRVDQENEGKPVTDFQMENCVIQLHDVERELWAGVVKGDLVLYYNAMATLILPHLKDRPQSLHLNLSGLGDITFIKDMENRQPDCAQIYSDKRRVRKAGKSDRIEYLVCNNLETLLFMVDTGCVDINPWASRIQSPENPDFIWLDLDPTTGESGSSEDLGFKMTVEIAMAAREVLKAHKIKAFPKTSGKTGIHIYIPVQDISFHQSRLIANHLADEIYNLVPDISTRSEGVSHRGKRVYIDANQNDYGDTLAAPYCIRPYHQPLASTPLDWKEVKPGLDRYDFNIHTIQKRIEKKGDLFSGVMEPKNAAENARRLSDLQREE